VLGIYTVKPVWLAPVA